MNGLQIESIEIVVKDMGKYEKSASYHFLKRIIDIIFSLLGIIAFFPIMFVVAVAIKFDSKGPIVFSQVRVGKYGKFFKMYKFRSIMQNSFWTTFNIKMK